MGKTNLTIQLDEQVVREARVVAARRGTSVSRLVAQELTELVANDQRYEAARQRATDLMARAESHGGRTWTRPDLYSERFDRNAKRG